MARSVSLWGVLSCVVLFHASVLARTLYVTTDGDDANSGESWAQAKRTVGAAVSAAVSGDEIWVARGVYQENLILKGGIKLYGGFVGTETTLDERPPFPRPEPDPNETVLDGGQIDRVITVFDTETAAVLIDGFTIRNGSQADYGGGVYCVSAPLHIQNCTVTGCVALIRGGGICFGAGSHIRNCIITYNEALGGGGLCGGGEQEVTLIEDCFIAYNRAGTGGGFDFQGGRTEMRRCSFEGNVATYEGGGGVVSMTCVLRLLECSFIENVAGTDGGALEHIGENTEIIKCQFVGNQAVTGGAIMCTRWGLAVSDSTFLRNSASRWGGAVRLFYTVSNPRFQRCVFMYNTASYGGAILADNYTMGSFGDCIIARNTARVDGGGVALYYHCLTTFFGCTIADNYAWRDGGGMFLMTTSYYQQVSNCTIIRNRALGSGGGIVFTDSASPGIQRCVVISNSAVRDGAGIFCRTGSSPKLEDCLILDNASENNGGGVYLIDGSNAVLDGCAVAYNSTKNSGGGIYAYNASPVVTSSLVSGNTASYYGGGLYCEWHASPQVLNSLILDNTAQRYGGGMYIYRECAPAVTNCTFAFNTAPNQGGGVYSYGSLPSIVNTVVAFNTSGIFRSGGSPVLRYNCVYGNTAYNYKGITDPTGTNGNISVDPLLTGRNGHLLPGSPCVDAGDNGSASGDWKDVDGEARIAGASVDIGADEFLPPTVSGTLTFGDYSAPVPPVVDMEVRMGAASVIRAVWLGADGSFTLPSAPTGTFDLSLKPSHWLRRTVGVDTSFGSVQGVDIQLVNGDIDGDNEVTLLDFGQMVAAFGAVPGDENWNTNADLDGDGEVTLFDLGVLVRNFGEIGDE